MMTVAAILKAAQALRESDRLRIAHELLDGLDGVRDSAWDQAWEAELDKRATDAEADRHSWKAGD